MVGGSTGLDWSLYAVRVLSGLGWPDKAGSALSPRLLPSSFFVPSCFLLFLSLLHTLATCGELLEEFVDRCASSSGSIQPRCNLFGMT